MIRNVNLEPGHVERRYVDMQLRAVDGKRGKKISGYAALFDTWSKDLSYRERIAPGAFKKSINESDIRALFNHNPDLVLGRTSAGTLRLREDDKGLWFELDPPDTQTARDLMVSIDRGDVSQMSFAFIKIKDTWENNETERILLEVELLDVSPVTYPAYEKTSVALRNREEIMNQETRKIASDRADKIQQARSILNGARDQRRNMNTIEGAAFRTACKEIDRMGSELNSCSDFGSKLQMTTDVGLLGVERELQEPCGSGPEMFPEIGNSGDSRGSRSGDAEWRFWDDPSGSSRRHAFNRLLLYGAGSLNDNERRNLQLDADVQGGYLGGPEAFVRELVKSLEDEVFIRALATTYPVTSGTSLGVPAINTEMGDAEWTKELGTGNEDTTLDIGKRELHPHPLARRIRVSNTLLRLAAMNPEDIVRQQMTYKFSTVQENAFLNGNGAQRPLGLMVASDQGISTSRDVSTDMLSTEITADGLIECVSALKGQYLKNARWVFHRDAVKQVRKLKDGNGQYLWLAGLQGMRPNTILDLPYHISEYMPNTFTASSYVGILGDFSYYWIADSLSFEIQVLKELYAETNQTGFIGRLETDGMPVLEEAFVRVKLAA